VAAGTSLGDVARANGVTLEDVRAALNFAAQRAAEPLATGGTGADPGAGPDRQADEPLTPAGAAEARHLGLDPAALSPLGRRLLAQRAKIRASGLPMLTGEQLDAEMVEQHGSEAESLPCRYPVGETGGHRSCQR